jgi:hypothetical protein
MGRKPATIDEVTAILMADLKKCDHQQIAIFRRYSVEPYFAPIVRYGIADKVVVVAQKSFDVIYWEDVGEGFNTAPTGPGGRVLEHSCNEDDLGVALHRLVQTCKRQTGNLEPANPLNSFHEKAGRCQGTL